MGGSQYVAQEQAASHWSLRTHKGRQARSEQLKTDAPSPDLLQRVSLQQSKCTLVLDDLISASCAQPSRWATDFDLHVAQFCFPSHHQAGDFIALHGLDTSMGLKVFSFASATSFNDGKPSSMEALPSMSAPTTSQCCPGGIVQPMETRLPPHPSFARMPKASISGHGRFLPTPRRVCRDKDVLFPTFSTSEVCRIFAA